MRKKVGIVKRMSCLLLIFLLSINSFAAIVSDNDGSAFITKAEFDALKSSFQAQIDSYNQSIDSKIDGAIASYLSGIKLSSIFELKNIYKDLTLPDYFDGGNSFGLRWFKQKYTNDKVTYDPSDRVEWAFDLYAFFTTADSSRGVNGWDPEIALHYVAGLTSPGTRQTVAVRDSTGVIQGLESFAPNVAGRSHYFSDEGNRSGYPYPEWSFLGYNWSTGICGAIDDVNSLNTNKGLKLTEPFTNTSFGDKAGASFFTDANYNFNLGPANTSPDGSGNILLSAVSGENCCSTTPDNPFLLTYTVKSNHQCSPDTCSSQYTHNTGFVKNLSMTVDDYKKLVPGWASYKTLKITTFSSTVTNTGWHSSLSGPWDLRTKYKTESKKTIFRDQKYKLSGTLDVVHPGSGVVVAQSDKDGKLDFDVKCSADSYVITWCGQTQDLQWGGPTNVYGGKTKVWTSTDYTNELWVNSSILVGTSWKHRTITCNKNDKLWVVVIPKNDDVAVKCEFDNIQITVEN